jgi:dsRNA-specific ribonuclease
MKAKAEERVKSKVTARQIDALGAKDFERLVKVQARLVDGDKPVDADEALVENFAKRIADERMPAICVTVALVEGPATPNWRAIHAILLEYLAHKPELAFTVFAMATQTYGSDWTPTFKTESQGPDHLKTFTVESHLKQGDGSYNVMHTDSPKKLAEQRAAVRLLAAVVGLSTPVFPEKTSAPIPSPTPPIATQKVSGYDGTKDPISFVNEYAQSLGKPLPTFQVEVTGPPHVPVMVATCTFLNKTAKGEAGNKQEAKRQAAKALIAQLGL